MRDRQLSPGARPWRPGHARLPLVHTRIVGGRRAPTPRYGVRYATSRQVATTSAGNAICMRPVGTRQKAARGGANESICKPSSVPQVPKHARRRSSISGRRLPDGSCGRPEGTAAHRSARRTGPLPSYLALLQVEFAAFHPAGRQADHRTRLCGTGPRLAADGRYPLPCAGELGLSSGRTGSRPARDHPIGSLAGRF